MRNGNRRPPSRRPLRAASALALLLLPLGWAGCSTLERGRTLVPTRHRAATGPFAVYSNVPLASDRPAIRYLQALERDVDRELGLNAPEVSDEDDASRVQIYVLDNREDYDHFLKFHYPELPHRRAFFLAKGEERLVYTYASPRLEEDLRHEATHALLRGAFGDLPLWLDEGLAEYFEDDLSRPEALRARLDAIAADGGQPWKPDLRRLESLADINQMNQRDYREAWAWVHLLLKGPEPGRAILMAYLGETDRVDPRAPLHPRLAAAKIDESGLLRHLDGLRSTAVASATPPAPATATFRLQDPQVKPSRKRTQRGLIGRLSAWLGF